MIVPLCEERIGVVPVQAPDKQSRAAWGAARKGGGGEGGAADREGAGRREEGVGNGWGVCLVPVGVYCILV